MKLQIDRIDQHALTGFINRVKLIDVALAEFRGGPPAGAVVDQVVELLSWTQGAASA